MLVEPNDTGETPMAGYFMNTEGGEALARREKKRRIGVYMEKELVERADEMVSSSPYPPCSPVPSMTVKIVWPVWILNLQWRFPNWLM